MKTSRVVEFMQSLVPGDFTAVRDAMAMNPSFEGVTLPLVYVYPSKEVAAPNSLDNHVRQNVSEQFAVLTLCAIADLETKRQKIFDKLLGAQLPDYVYEITYVGGEVLDISGTAISWKDTFETKRDRRQT